MPPSPKGAQPTRGEVASREILPTDRLSEGIFRISPDRPIECGPVLTNRGAAVWFESQNQSFTQTVPPADVASCRPKHTDNATYLRDGTLFRFPIDSRSVGRGSPNLWRALWNCGASRDSRGRPSSAAMRRRRADLEIADEADRNRDFGFPAFFSLSFFGN